MCLSSECNLNIWRASLCVMLTRIGYRMTVPDSKSIPISSAMPTTWSRSYYSLCLVALKFFFKSAENLSRNAALISVFLFLFLDPSLSAEKWLASAASTFASACFRALSYTSYYLCFTVAESSTSSTSSPTMFMVGSDPSWGIFATLLGGMD